ncbi:MAG TPA: LamG domain-containing protein [Sedimentisphaerales bacterium]|nr:LamG domain-containing protein [Sedimentisphaerales bacterium]
MSKKMIYLVSFVFVLGLVLTSAAKAIDPDLIGYWNFDETSGTTAQDATGNGNDGTLNGDPQWAAGRLGGALEFDGEGDYVDIGNDPIFNITDQITVACWIKVNQFTYDWQAIFTMGDDSWRLQRQTTTDNLCWACTGVTGTPGDWWLRGDVNVNDGEWHHIAGVYDGSKFYLYVDGDLDASKDASGTIDSSSYPVFIGANAQQSGREFDGLIDDARVYKRALMDTEILGVMSGGGAEYPLASGPVPKDGALYADTWVSLSWRAGDFAVSHDVYMGDNFEDVNDGAGDTFRGNQDGVFYAAGFPGYAYPDGLVPGTTYYWRIDEVNEAEPNSPWKGDVWSFSIPPKTSYFPIPADGAEFIDLDVQLKWTAGFGAKFHYIVFGEDFDEVSNAVTGTTNGTADYTPGPLKLAKTYYWRVDEFDGAATHKGEVWSFTTLGAVSGPNPSDGDMDVKPSVLLSWDAGAVAASHEVYFGTDADAVKNATTASPEYKGAKALGEENYDPGKLTLNTTYYWRIDEVNGISPDSPWAGNVWSFATGDFFVIDDFEDYNAGENQIWYSWHDGLGYGAPGTDPYFAGNGTGSAVGDETTASFTEETIVHGGLQSMPVMYDNNKQGYANYSEAELTLSAVRDWTEEGVTELSLWFRGYPGSVGSFVEGPAGTYTMTGSGADIWDISGLGTGYHDEFHFAYKILTGVGSIVAKVESVENTNTWAKAGVMIRESLDPGSVHATMAVTPGQGISFQRRTLTGDVSSHTTTGGVEAPYWVKIERDLSGNITAYSSANGSTWQIQGTPENIQMSSNVYIGLALTSHDAAQTCQAVFTNVTTSGSVGPQWANQDIGITSNAAEPLYVAVSNSAGTPAVVVHDDPAAATIDTWTQWVIPLQAFADQGISLTNVDRIAIGLGTKGNITVPGGSGKMFFDDIRLYMPRESAEE